MKGIYQKQRGSSKMAERRRIGWPKQNCLSTLGGLPIYTTLASDYICNSGLPIYTIKLDSFRCITLSMVVGSVIIQSKSVGGESWALAFLSTSPFFCAFKTSPPKSLISSFGEKFSQIMMFLEGGLLFCLNQISTTNI